TGRLLFFLTDGRALSPGLGTETGHGRRDAFFMVNRNLLRQFDLSDHDLQQELSAAFRDEVTGEPLDMDKEIVNDRQVFEVNKIVTGRVANIVGDDVVIDIGYK